MRLAISNLAWDPAEDLAVAEVLLAHKIDAVEIAPTKYWPAPCHPSDDELKRCREFWETQGIAIVALQSLLYGQAELNLFSDDAGQAEMLDYLDGIIRVGAALGAGSLVFGSPRNRNREGYSDAEAFEIGVSFFSRLAPRAAEAGVIIALEPNPPQYNCNFATTAAEALQIVQAVDHAGLRLNLDSGILRLNAEPIEPTISECVPWMSHFHISEPKLAPVGASQSAETRHAEIATSLIDSGYDGCISIEMLSANEPATDRQTVDAALAFARSTYFG